MDDITVQSEECSLGHTDWARIRGNWADNVDKLSSTLMVLHKFHVRTTTQHRVCSFRGIGHFPVSGSFFTGSIMTCTSMTPRIEQNIKDMLFWSAQYICACGLHDEHCKSRKALQVRCHLRFSFYADHTQTLSKCRHVRDGSVHCAQQHWSRAVRKIMFYDGGVRELFVNIALMFEVMKFVVLVASLRAVPPCNES